MKDFIVEFNLSDDGYFTALRLVAGAVCSSADMDLDGIEDFKLCVTESALILKNGGFERVKAVFSSQDGVRAEISGAGGTPAECENALSLSLISALVGKCDISRVKGVINKVTLEV